MVYIALEIYHSPYLPNVLKNYFSLVLQNFLYLELFESNVTSGWLNHAV